MTADARSQSPGACLWETLEQICTRPPVSHRSDVYEAARATMDAVVQALTAAGFDVRAASPLQHHADCGFWRDRPCDCAIQHLQEVVDNRGTR